MNVKRPLVQILAIVSGTLVLALAGVMLLIGEVRQEFLRILRRAFATPHISPAIWGVIFSLVVCGIAYLVVRKMILATIPSLSKAHDCPRCGSHLQRIPRRQSERVMAIVLCSSILRYGCVDCEWSGLRRHRHQHATTLKQTG